MTRNYNINYFDTLYDHDEVLGFRVDSIEEINDVVVVDKVSWGWNIIERMLNMTYNDANSEHKQNDNSSRTVFIPDLKIKFYDFNISDRDKRRLIEQGSTSAKLFIGENYG